jgi:hypothetical protein
MPRVAVKRLPARVLLTSHRSGTVFYTCPNKSMAIKIAVVIANQHV